MYGNLVVGHRTGISISNGSYNVLIGHGIDVPAPNTNCYICVEGTVYPYSKIEDPKFQEFVRTRAHAVVDTMTEYPKYVLESAHRAIEEHIFVPVPPRDELG